MVHREATAVHPLTLAAEVVVGRAGALAVEEAALLPSHTLRVEVQKPASPPRSNAT
jgi:hypothetical protein